MRQWARVFSEAIRSKHNSNENDTAQLCRDFGGDSRRESPGVDVEIDDLYLAEDGLGLAAALRGGRGSASGLLEAALAGAGSINPSLGALC
jgi:hypothetical protein